MTDLVKFQTTCIITNWVDEYGVMWPMVRFLMHRWDFPLSVCLNCGKTREEVDATSISKDGSADGASVDVS